MHIKPMRARQTGSSISARLVRRCPRLFVVSLTVVIGYAKQTLQEAEASLGLDIVVRTDIGPTVAGSACRACDLKFTARCGSGQHDLSILQTILRHQRIKLGGILRRDAHTA